MRLWEKRLLPYLPDKFIIAQWRECIAIKRQWEKGTLKHRLVSYVMNYDRQYFETYVMQVVVAMVFRNIKFQSKYYREILSFCSNDEPFNVDPYPEHNDRYLRQCYYNLQEKYDRGIVSEEEWTLIYKEFHDMIKEE